MCVLSVLSRLGQLYKQTPLVCVQKIAVQSTVGFIVLPHRGELKQENSVPNELIRVKFPPLRDHFKADESLCQPSYRMIIVKSFEKQNFQDDSRLPRVQSLHWSKSRFGHQQETLEANRGSTARMRLKMTNWSACHKMEFLKALCLVSNSGEGQQGGQNTRARTRLRGHATR